MNRGGRAGEHHPRSDPGPRGPRFFQPIHRLGIAGQSRRKCFIETLFQVRFDGSRDAKTRQVAADGKFGEPFPAQYFRLSAIQYQRLEQVVEIAASYNVFVAFSHKNVTKAEEMIARQASHSTRNPNS